MKYHGHIITKTPEDLGEENPRDNFVYKIEKDSQFIANALTLSTAKQFIDSGYNQAYL